MQKRKPSPQELFTTRITAVYPNKRAFDVSIFEDLPTGATTCWPTSRPEYRQAREKLCNDDRVESLWRLTEQLSDREFERFGFKLFEAWWFGTHPKQLRAEIQDVVQTCASFGAAIAQARAKLSHLCDNYSGFLGYKPEKVATVETAFQQIEAFIAKQDEKARTELQPLIAPMTRKIRNFSHVEFVGLATMLMRNVFNRPHYEIIANMVCVLFNKEADSNSVRLTAKDWAKRRFPTGAG
jgi:hypothetical protein